MDPFWDPFWDPQEAISALPALGLLARGGPKRGPKRVHFWTPPRDPFWNGPGQESLVYPCCFGHIPVKKGVWDPPRGSQTRIYR